jgi:hypothetical protein
MILDRSKRHTVRPRRKRATVPGDMLYLNTGMRTKKFERIAISTCIKIEPVVIYPYDQKIVLMDTSGKMSMAGVATADHLARLDGFMNMDDFFYFFKRYKKNELDDFEIIHWDTGKFFMPVMGTKGELALLRGEA